MGRLQFLNGYKTYMGGVSLVFLALGSILQGLSDGGDVDWNRAITDLTIGLSILGAAKKADKPKPP